MMHPKSSILFGALFLLLFGSSAGAGNPDASPPSRCDALSGHARRLCEAFCDIKNCPANDRISCERIRSYYHRFTGAAEFPCEFCGLPQDTGPCRAAIPRWWHNPETGRCERFIYGGCGGNANNFESQALCERGCGQPLCELECDAHQECRIFPPTDEPFCADTCMGVVCPAGTMCELVEVQCVREPCPPLAQCVPKGPDDICELPQEVGPCEAAIPRWWHNPETGRCERFIYGGCGGNANNFETLQQCERSCAPDACDTIQCREHQECRIFPPTGEPFCADTCEGFPCREGSHCELVPVVCVREPCPPVAQCIADEPDDVCALRPDRGPCAAVIPRWFFNAETGRCERFDWGGCGGNANNFETLQRCEESCVCSQPRDAGPCDAVFPRWFFNPESGQCRQFVWGGCGGNGNNFGTEESCERVCEPLICEFVCAGREPGYTFPAPDGCNTCTCLADGTIACTERACPKCQVGDRAYEPGETFPAPDGCNVCTCLADGGVACTERACPQCEVDGTMYRPGDTFPAGDACNFCRCLPDGRVTCTAKPCAVCITGDERHEPGETFPSPDGCNTCSCLENGRVVCTLRACHEPADEERCVQSGGSWEPSSCGHYRCGEPLECLAVIPGCDCGEGKNFFPGRGCVEDKSCAARIQRQLRGVNRNFGQRR